MPQPLEDENALIFLHKDGSVSAYFDPTSKNVFFREQSISLFNCGPHIDADEVERLILVADPKEATARRGLFSNTVTLSDQKDDKRDLPSEISPEFFNATMEKAQCHLKPINHDLGTEGGVRFVYNATSGVLTIDASKARPNDYPLVSGCYKARVNLDPDIAEVKSSEGSGCTLLVTPTWYIGKTTGFVTLPPRTVTLPTVGTKTMLEIFSKIARLKGQKGHQAPQPQI